MTLKNNGIVRRVVGLPAPASRIEVRLAQARAWALDIKPVKVNSVPKTRPRTGGEAVGMRREAARRLGVRWISSMQEMVG